MIKTPVGFIIELFTKKEKPGPVNTAPPPSPPSTEIFTPVGFVIDCTHYVPKLYAVNADKP